MRLVLVVDVGGGTTDFTLMHAERAADGRRRCTRLAVGDHLLLGGDNMDLALARAVEARLGGAAARRGQFAAAGAGLPRAKERLLADGAPGAAAGGVVGPRQPARSAARSRRS